MECCLTLQERGGNRIQLCIPSSHKDLNGFTTQHKYLPCVARRTKERPRLLDFRCNSGTDTVTGRSAVGVAAGSFSSPRFSARLHLNTWFASAREHVPPAPRSRQRSGERRV